MEGITIVKGVLETAKVYLAKPECMLTTKTDFFGNVSGENDVTQHKLQESPENETMFLKMAEVCLTAVITVLERQYDRYFAMDVSKKLEEETESARCHNIDAEEIMGMFSATPQMRRKTTCHPTYERRKMALSITSTTLRRTKRTVLQLQKETTAKGIGAGEGGAGATDCPGTGGEGDSREKEAGEAAEVHQLGHRKRIPGLGRECTQ